jgi:hypothetical protein
MQEPQKSLIQAFIEGGWLVPLIGASGMIARILSSHERITAGLLFKRIPAAAISSAIAWYILEQTPIDSLYKAVIYGIVGVISPEVIDGIVRIAKRASNNPGRFIPWAGPNQQHGGDDKDK